MRGRPARLGGDLAEALRDPVDDPVLHLVGAMRRHGRRAPGLRQGAIEIGHGLARVAVEHVEDGDGGDEAVVIAAPDRRVEEEMAGLLEAGQGVQVVHPALDVGMAGLPVVGLGALRLQHRVGGEEAGRLHVDDELGAGVQRRQVARQHHADLVGEDLVALVVDHAAAVAVAVEAEADIGAGLAAPSRPWRAASPCLRGWGCSAGRCGRARCRAGRPRSRAPPGSAARRRRRCRCRRRRPPSAGA